MTDTVFLTSPRYRMLVAIRYLNASEALFEGMKRQQGVNDLHFLVTFRSFIEYTRRGIWFLAWASETALRVAEKLTFRRGGSPTLIHMDEMVNVALGLGRVSHLQNIVPHVNEPFLDCLHALTHGNPISVRMFGIGLPRIFQIDKMLIRAEMELNMFRILVYRHAAGESLKSVWVVLASINNRPDDMKANAKSAAIQVKADGGLDRILARL